jgi:hypothetical protein
LQPARRRTVKPRMVGACALMFVIATLETPASP